MLYPRLGDWAVIKPTPTEKDPAAYEVVAAGLFDENWQFRRSDLPTDSVRGRLELPCSRCSPTSCGGEIFSRRATGEFYRGAEPKGPDGCIYFSDIGNRIMKFDPKTGKTTEFRDPSGRANGLKFDATGRLIACEGANTGGGRRISITEKDGTVKTAGRQVRRQAVQLAERSHARRQGPHLFLRPAVCRRGKAGTRSRVRLPHRS